MKGKPEVLKELNDALASELKAIMQYMVHGEMAINWGYERWGGIIKKQAIDEMRHAEGLIERILLLDGTPKVDISLNPNIGASVEKQIKNDLAEEHAAVKQYNNATAVCAKAGDNASRAMFEGMTKDEEQHTDFLEAQLQMITDIGIENFLARQMKNGEGAA